ncbi:histidine phosphatase family protein [Paenibacillus sp. V4I7]|uniref:histidine phosphatase family protein n=1 Tax=Paenibacillus sp. V4I7 TaxID=3042307 RepID=UPI00277FB82D|nr:histidine phosphatase family protein [Paenibacillus sp. V4I7]MDQ0898746.1 2,3-bisphosphoglycerate-dependent phosphoglycerate mutase [Paenibacillus sp. V4I7]
MKTYIYFIRHGIAPFSIEHERTGGTRLSEQGKLDAKRVAEILSNEDIDVIVSSSYFRALETVSPLAELLKKEIIPYIELIERPIASLNYAVSEEELLIGIEQSFVDIDFCLPEGETTRQAQERAIPLIMKLLSDFKGKKIAIGTHGNIMTIILNYFDANYGFEFWKQTTKPDIYRLEFEEKELNLVERLWN